MNDQAADYKHTILLPKTEFPMQAQLAKREPDMLKNWLAAGLYEAVMAASAGRTPFWFVDGPPYANGDIHIGHAVNKVLKDIVVKSARLDGYSAVFTPGWDCHGLPIELQVEKKFGKVGDKLDAKTFRTKCREYAYEQIDRQREDFKRLGILADWDRPYLTMDPKFEAEQLRVLSRIVERGHVVRGFKPVHWCLDCGSSLAEAEVEYQDKVSSAIDVRFAASDVAALAKVFAASEIPSSAGFVIWTTTPWTLPANRAIAVGAELDYVLAAFDGLGALVLAEGLLAAAAKRYGVAEPRVLGRAKGAALEGLKAQHPFAAYEVPLILGEHVTLEAGTGLVHTAPAHGVEDYVVGKQYGLAVDNPVGSNGVFIEGTPVVAGLHVRKAEEPILEALRANGGLVHLGKLEHSYPHCWRHKSPLIFRATPQWFISMDENGLRANALAEIAKTRFIPDWGRERIHEMVATRPDWCISRQRYWGVPLAVFAQALSEDLFDPNDYLPENISSPWTPLSAEQTRQKKSRQWQFAASVLRKVADAVETEGLDAWFDSDPKRWLPEELHSVLEGRGIFPVRDTLDVWFDSGSVHQGMFKSLYPQELDADGIAPQADFYLEGSDQHRGWFQSSLLTCVAMQGRAPYKAVLTHGFTVDEQGRKMSKSLGNVVAPQAVVKELGADVLRLWVAGSDYRGEIAVSNELLKRIADAYRRIRNTARYLLGSLHGFDPAQHLVTADQLLPVDAWAIARAAEVQQELQAAYRAADFHLVYQQLHNYCVVDLGGLYLDILKDRLYTLPEAHPARRSAQTALLHIAEAMVRWIAPILSFTADEIWQLLPGDRSVSVFAQTWYVVPDTAAKAGVIDWAQLLNAREAVKKVLEDLRTRSVIGSSLDASIALYADGAMLSALQALGSELRFWFITSEAVAAPSAVKPAEAFEAQGGGLWISAQASVDPKCQRCWHHRPDVGSVAEHPTLCGRCAVNIAGAGEVRELV